MEGTAVQTQLWEKLGICARNSLNPRFWTFLLRRAGVGALEWEHEPLDAGVPRRPLQELVRLREDFRITLPLVDRVYGDTPYADLVALCALVRDRQPRRIFEFGTYTGATTLQMIANAPADAQVWTLDMPPATRQEVENLHAWDRSVDDGVIGKHFRGTDAAARIHQLFANSTEFDPAPFARSMDLVFIDACHDYEFVVNDSRKAFEMLAPGGVIVWHDYPGFEGVRRHLHELAERYPIVQVEDTILAVYCDPSS